jgi:hypothetical protein
MTTKFDRLAEAANARDLARLGLDHALASTARVKGPLFTPEMAAEVASEEHAAQAAMTTAEAQFAEALGAVVEAPHV